MITWAAHPFSAISDSCFFRMLKQAFGERDARNAFRLAVAPYLKRGPPLGVPRISLQLFSDQDWAHIRYMQIRGEVKEVWPFRIEAKPAAQPHGVWKHGEVQFLLDDDLWEAVKGSFFFFFYLFLILFC